MREPWAQMDWQERNTLVAEHVIGRNPDTGWHALDEWGEIPRYEGRIEDAQLVEDEIEKRGLETKYISCLQEIVWNGEYSEHDYPLELKWRLLRATPEQRCLAALRACGVEL